MGGDGVNDISAGAGERIGGMVNGAGLTLGSNAKSGAETRVNNELAKVREFSEGDNVGLVKRSWVDGSEERIWKPSLGSI